MPQNQPMNEPLVCSSLLQTGLNGRTTLLRELQGKIVGFEGWKGPKLFTSGPVGLWICAVLRLVVLFPKSLDFVGTDLQAGKWWSCTE